LKPRDSSPSGRPLHVVGETECLQKARLELPWKSLGWFSPPLQERVPSASSPVFFFFSPPGGQGFPFSSNTTPDGSLPRRGFLFSFSLPFFPNKSFLLLTGSWRSPGLVVSPVPRRVREADLFSSRK